MLVIPTPESIYRGNYASLPANTLKPPIEANRTVPVEINWLASGQPTHYTIHFNARQQQTLAISQISALHIDNSNCGSSMHVAFPDTQFEVVVGPNTVGFYPVVTNSLEFWAWIDLTPLAQDKTIIQVLNFLPPPIFFTTQPGGTGVGTVRNVGTAAPITGGPITDSGTIGLSTPLAVNFGGTGGTTGNAAFDNLSGATGTLTGALSRNSSGVWSVQPAPVVPVTVANGGTGQVTLGAGNLLVGNGTNPVNSPAALNWNAATLTITGGLSVSAQASAPTPAPGDSSTNIATTAFIATALGGYLPLTGGRLTGGLASGPAATPIPSAGALILNANTVAPPAGISPRLYIVGPDGGSPSIGMDAFGGINFLYARRANGTAAAPTATAANDILFLLQAAGYAAGAYTSPANSFTLQAAEAWTSTAQGSYWQFNTVIPGTTTQANSLRLQGNTATFSGTTSAYGAVNVNGTAADQSPAFAIWDHFGTTRATLQFFESTGQLQLTNTSPGPNSSIFLPVDGSFGTTAATATKPGGGSWAAPSDARIKTVSGPYDKGLADVVALNPVIYTYKGNDAPPDGASPNAAVAEAQTPFAGLIAQEVEPIFPGMVHSTAGYIDGEPVDDLRQLDTTPLIFALVNAIKELSAKVAALEAKVGA